MASQFVCLSSGFLLLLLAIIPRDSFEQDYWRPQGRFGKRSERAEPPFLAALQEELLPTLSLRQLHSKLAVYKKPLSSEHAIEAVGALCLRQAAHQNYRCFRITSDEGESFDDAFTA